MSSIICLTLSGAGVSSIPVNDLSTLKPPENGAAPDNVPAEAAPIFPLSDIDEIRNLQQRVRNLEAEQKRFTDALQYAGKFLFSNPASKMILMSLPKEMKEKLQEYFSG
jgi:hypothetical protein